MARIALDAMGGDFAPQATVAGALLALAELDPAHSIQLVGRTAVVDAQLRDYLDGDFAALAHQRDRITIVEAPDVIEMTDKPSAAVRGKPNSSMAVGLRLQTDGSSDAFVSAGSTGAQMAASMVLLKLHAGLKRPAIVTLFPSARKTIAVLDSGANVDCSAEELVQFARLGATYAECMLGRANPAVGLLSIGEEAEKGNAVTKETHPLLVDSGLNFIGNVEGRDLPAGGTEHQQVDVVVCDGFVGNVVLKFYEGVAPLMMETLRKAGVSSDQLESALKHLDYSEHGGAPLLGVKGVSIIAHGKSSPRAVKNAVKVAAQAVTSRMNDRIGERLGAVAASAEDAA
ncbi:MAG: phosphate acyltransferase PlsX [Gemmatimonadaceae bacterium]|nr:phosphate acyltransferase PlsX [Gemmatimonadaceae bacterium]NUO94090.1 phosphate acyltransferase PlsX [Gemmatimonadaceae bacterium]NUP54593.1 phosphate acyltransferase PlsX [Gemmatimonadaceae bacterium]NUP72297.1 phosphate acyltransferase PlsX [Gemmatimonadaceae bacterium]NUR33526.1 phosphate acyltransferase PlsX [Gemmatimonadaceae bacterium]